MTCNRAADEIDQVHRRTIGRLPPSAITLTLSGQVETMRESYNGLFSGMALAVVLVYLFWSSISRAGSIR